MSDDSDGGENPRKRIRQACLNCRRKKVRCGGEKPVCTFCSRLAQSCVYQTPPSSTDMPIPVPIPEPQETSLPPIHTLQSAADVYFRFCHNQPYSFFHEPTFRRRLASGKLPDHLAWALLSAVRRYSALPDLALRSEDDATVYATRAWECLELPWAGAPSDEEAVAVVQTIILIVCTEHPAGYCAAAYMKLGFAIRIALHSKLHMEPGIDVSPIFREERKRTFWSLYLQDKLVNLSRERLSSLRDEECKIPLPCSEAAFREGRVEETPLIHSVTGDCLDQEAADACCPLALIMIMASTLGRVSHYVLQETRYSQSGLPWSSTSPYAAISSTLLQLEHYFGVNEDPKESLARRCFVNGAIDPNLAGSFIYSKALFHLSHCLLHHPFLIQQRLQKLKHRTPPTFIKTAWESCRAHATSLTELKDMKNHNVVILTSVYGYCTMVAGTIHVLTMNDEDAAIREAGKKRYNAALEFLRELSCYWKHAALMVNRLERFRLQCENRRQEFDPCTQNTTHSPHDLKALWQSVDYALLSTPTRPGSPMAEDAADSAEFFVSPGQLFDFADIGMFAEGVGAFETLPIFESSMALAGEDLEHNAMSNAPPAD
ncbi:fungal-specific transcription factor domain-containing protein [Dactylonectria estremocensis]|uniref:Fungal-specific transcription factor domain-containing protein n=1 Tax=Dactylonectria estremocensis TaxID=1079267 RepID=A0A9P9J3T9_9HYPO|nr:fungal-specific transcription factor domain-containing protein [Dactylonectria estremocensis]